MEMFLCHKHILDKMLENSSQVKTKRFVTVPLDMQFFYLYVRIFSFFFLNCWPDKTTITTISNFSEPSIFYILMT